MTVSVHFYSYFKDLTGCTEAKIEVAEGATVGELLAAVLSQYPRLAPLQKSMLIAVGVDYAPRELVLRAGDEVSLFPPVQGG
jgi:molybdopterin converting factor small subunit